MSGPTDRTGCWCAGTRQPCPYHEGAQDAADVEAERTAALTAELDRLRAIVASLIEEDGDGWCQP